VQPKIKDTDRLGANANIHTISFSCLCLSTDSKRSSSDSLPTQDNHQIIDLGKRGGGGVELTIIALKAEQQSQGIMQTQ
jgi:hypothetical protein